MCLIVNKQKSHVSGNCFTISGAIKGKKCIFPFRYNGVLHHQCTKDDHDKLWCSTQIDENGDYVDGQWGNCGPCGSGKLMKVEGILTHCYFILPIASLLGLSGGRQFRENEQMSEASNNSHPASNRKAGRFWPQIFTIIISMSMGFDDE